MLLCLRLLRTKNQKVKDEVDKAKSDLPSDLTVVPTYGNSCGIGAPKFRAIATVNSGRLKRIDESGAKVKGNEFAKTLLCVLQKAILR